MSAKPAHDGACNSASDAPEDVFSDTHERFVWEDWVGVAIVAALSVMTLLNVLVRYFTSASFAWTEEISVFLMLLLTLVGASAAAARNRHIQIDLLAARLSPKCQVAIHTLWAAVGLATLGLLAAVGAVLAWDEYVFEETSPGLGWPKWIYTVWLPVMAAVIGARMGLYAWRYARAQKNTAAKDAQP